MHARQIIVWYMVMPHTVTHNHKWRQHALVRQRAMMPHTLIVHRCQGSWPRGSSPFGLMHALPHDRARVSSRPCQAQWRHL